MALYRIDEAGGSLRAIPETSLSGEGKRERGDLQAWLRDCPDVLEDGLFVLAEEYGEWADSGRRIDLLALDEHGRLVVVELKRDQAAFMDLQALRYAALVAHMWTRCGPRGSPPPWAASSSTSAAIATRGDAASSPLCVVARDHGLNAFPWRAGSRGGGVARTGHPHATGSLSDRKLRRTGGVRSEVDGQAEPVRPLSRAVRSEPPRERLAVVEGNERVSHGLREALPG